jgi:uncharacterized FlaG/YvyC family protein
MFVTMNAQNQSLLQLLADYEVACQARLAMRSQHDRMADDDLEKTVRLVEDNDNADQKKLEDEKQRLSDKVAKLQEEALSLLDTINDNLRVSNELRNKCYRVVDSHIGNHRAAKDTLEQERASEDINHRKAFICEMVCCPYEFVYIF